MTALTHDSLVTAVITKAGGITLPVSLWTAEMVADSIRLAGLEEAIVPGTRPPLTFAQGYALVFNASIYPHAERKVAKRASKVSTQGE